MSEYRRDLATGRWTVIAPERGRRPREWTFRKGTEPSAAAFDPECPFCPGNEKMLPDIVYEVPSESEPGWRTRVVPNKFPAVSHDAGYKVDIRGIHAVATGYGCHDVVIETPRHDVAPATLRDEDMEAVISTYLRRYRAHVNHPHVRSVVVFRNHGETAGSSLRHPHSQIIAAAVVPPAVQARRDWLRRQYEAAPRCVMCEIAAFETGRRRRVIHEGDRFVLIVPFAASTPFEMCLIPKRHRASFANVARAEQIELAVILRRALGALKSALDDPPYNFFIESASTKNGDAPYLHWYLRIVPSLVRPGGFELASGLTINPSIPEDDAIVLRDAYAS